MDVIAQRRLKRYEARFIEKAVWYISVVDTWNDSDSVLWLLNNSTVYH